ncbi:hypothetical protein F8388_014400 [Cannabis sativa]|uniref:Ubiquitin-like protease family profile domain-containing protein n=1 Tax=Cannabis sativa TaxID=3483 RepID=A0A7J6FYA9_CANSA|nr:hypothetical protein F8388_014400 [Cannabis sativa]
MHHLNGATSEPERHGPDGATPSPVHQIVDLRDHELRSLRHPGRRRGRRRWSSCISGGSAAGSGGGERRYCGVKSYGSLSRAELERNPMSRVSSEMSHGAFAGFALLPRLVRCVLINQKYEPSLKKKSMLGPQRSHDKDKVYLKGNVEDVATKMWFHKLAYPGQCLTNSHLDIIFYYIRKKGKYAKEPKVKFTTTDCLFFKTIHALYEKFVAQKKDLSLITAQHAIADYIRGRKMLCGSPWHLCDHVLFIIHMETESHWILGRLNIEERRMYMYNSLSTAMKDSAAIKACQPFAVLLPHFFALFDEFKKENKPVCLDPFEVVKVDGLPQQTSNFSDVVFWLFSSDCGCFVASFAEYFIDMKPIPPIFDVEKYRDRLAVLFYKYARMKEVDFIDSEDEAPPKDYVHNHRQVVVSIILTHQPSATASNSPPPPSPPSTFYLSNCNLKSHHLVSLFNVMWPGNVGWTDVGASTYDVSSPYGDGQAANK